jgi:stage II sporulation protein D
MTITVTRRTASGRAAAVLLAGTAGQVEVKGNDLRWVLGIDRLRSTWFEASSTFIGWRFEGRGWGHGVGMCQDGARGRARSGQTYREILAAYFPGATVTVFRDEPLKLSARGGAIERATYSKAGE